MKTTDRRQAYGFRPMTRDVVLAHEIRRAWQARADVWSSVREFDGRALLFRHGLPMLSSVRRRAAEAMTV